MSAEMNAQLLQLRLRLPGLIEIIGLRLHMSKQHNVLFLRCQQRPERRPGLKRLGNRKL